MGNSKRNTDVPPRHRLCKGRSLGCFEKSEKRLQRNSGAQLAGEAEKLAKRLHPRDEEAAERHAIDAVLGALERPLAAEVQKLGCRTLEDVVAAARRIEKVLEEQTDSKMERLISSMQDQIRLLKKDLKEAHDQISTHQAAATPTTALAATPAVTVAAAYPPPLTQPPPLATAQPPPPSPTRHLYQDYPEEDPYFRQPHRQPDRRPPRRFLCGEEAHFVSHFLARSVLQRLLRQQASDNACGPPRGQVLELPPTEDGDQNSPHTHLNC